MIKCIYVLFIILFLNLATIGFAEDEQPSTFAGKILEEIENGVMSGEMGVYYELKDYDRDILVVDDKIIKLDDGDLIVPYIQIDYITHEYSGFSIGAGLTGYTHINSNSERKDDLNNFNEVIIHQLYVKYDRFQTSFKIGRQELEDFIFLRDYYEALSLTSRYMKNVSLYFAVVRKAAESDIEKFIEFKNINRGHESIDDVLYAAETTWDVVPDAFTTTLYYYHQGNLYDLYGTHVDLSHETEKIAFGLHADAYSSDEHNANGLRDANDNVKNSYIYHIAPFIQFNELTLAAGYIGTDRDVGAREGGLLDDYFNPFNEGAKVYESDARTWYGGLKYKTENINVGLILGSTEYLDGTQRFTEDEFDIYAGLNFLSNFKLNTEYSIISSNSPEGDLKILKMSLSYEF